MTDAVYVEKFGNQFRLTVHAESMAEAQCLMNLVLNSKSPDAFQPAPPLKPETEALLDRQDAQEVE